MTTTTTTTTATTTTTSATSTVNFKVKPRGLDVCRRTLRQETRVRQPLHGLSKQSTRLNRCVLLAFAFNLSKLVTTPFYFVVAP
ncbi:hypothetical protein E2C01_086592 [Portunus trituberculatus]|uniref:Uncharacterized protein n=1 Tax=Portunus trituberculatus TaxID=210409 RepID=A0A5B7JDW1_PORTR|nr:hypothetical protein [Portunus trituberculatus]